jgi:hypothetical protein
MRFALITLALLAMILGPLSGPVAMAHAVPVAAGSCDHEGAPIVEQGSQVHGNCTGGFGCCLNTNGCRDQSCFSGTIVPPRAANVPGNLAHISCPVLADDVALGRTVAPLLDPPRSTV